MTSSPLYVDAQEPRVLSDRHLFADIPGRQGIETVAEAYVVVGVDLHRSPAGDIDAFVPEGEKGHFLLVIKDDHRPFPGGPVDPQPGNVTAPPDGLLLDVDDVEMVKFFQTTSWGF